MAGTPGTTSASRWLIRGAYVLGALAGLWFGYGFGRQLSGFWLGVLTALNGALFGSIIAGAVAERLSGRRRNER